MHTYSSPHAVSMYTHALMYECIASAYVCVCMKLECVSRCVCMDVCARMGVCTDECMGMHGCTCVVWVMRAHTQKPLTCAQPYSVYIHTCVHESTKARKHTLQHSIIVLLMM